MISEQKSKLPDLSSQPDERILAVIGRFKNQLEQIRQEELNRYSKKMAATEIQLAEEVSMHMMQNILNIPWEKLQTSGHSKREMQTKLLGEVFNLT
ncbi:hypothetical protein GXP67_18425 [Rhodocytophaga rosea]|uniref:Tetrapyrrole biosynthesis glutamyl-tRNA reductase dimerisation domain-containing protein n=1 Tax=Rhodocytophaga rosea TaxID=2704465 RepID=A0A6C0GKK1_9BACT|nr:hypothetical protein [Rhodocytophaga rosea]QHT68477.1 hypothetical protein GXP67_18425 [Rhodocytophaga rosea]